MVVDAPVAGSANAANPRNYTSSVVSVTSPLVRRKRFRGSTSWYGKFRELCLGGIIENVPGLFRTKVWKMTVAILLKNGFHVVAHARMPMNQLKIKSKRKRLIIRFARASPGEKPTLEVSAKVDTS